jgi:hypothetical protein
LSFLRHVNCCLFSLYILQTSINLLVFIKDFKLFTDCLQTLPVRKPDFNVYGSIGTSASRGVAILINKAVNYKVIDKVTDENGTSINLLDFIKDFKLFTDCLQTLPVRKLLRSMSCIISLKTGI